MCTGWPRQPTAKQQEAGSAALMPLQVGRGGGGARSGRPEGQQAEGEGGARHNGTSQAVADRDGGGQPPTYRSLDVVFPASTQPPATHTSEGTEPATTPPDTKHPPKPGKIVDLLPRLHPQRWPERVLAAAIAAATLLLVLRCRGGGGTCSRRLGRRVIHPEPAGRQSKNQQQSVSHSFPPSDSG